MSKDDSNEPPKSHRDKLIDKYSTPNQNQGDSGTRTPLKNPELLGGKKDTPEAIMERGSRGVKPNEKFTDFLNRQDSEKKLAINLDKDVENRQKELEKIPQEQTKQDKNKEPEKDR